MAAGFTGKGGIPPQNFLSLSPRKSLRVLTFYLSEHVLPDPSFMVWPDGSAVRAYVPLHICTTHSHTHSHTHTHAVLLYSQTNHEDDGHWHGII